MLSFLQTFKMPAAINLGPFGVVFPGLLAQIWTNLYHIFTCDTLQNNASHMSQFLRTKILKNKVKKLIFWLILRGFLFTLAYTLRVTLKFLAKLKFLSRYIILVSFISIAVVVVKLKIFKVFLLIQHPRNDPFWGVFGS